MSADQQQGGVTVAELEACLRTGLPDVGEHLLVVDVSAGCGAKFEVYVSAAQLEGMKLLERHRLIQGLVSGAGLMQRIHALTIKAHGNSPTERAKWQKAVDEHKAAAQQQQ
jgi:stress-induced morphogen